MSTLLRTSLAFVFLWGCSPEQSKDIGQQPKKTVDRATENVNKAMQQGTDRLKEEQK